VNPSLEGRGQLLIASVRVHRDNYELFVAGLSPSQAHFQTATES
jgi:hypothetical protein